ncbi:hypothetical protein G4Z16_28990 [Streptomyces bathyalis]|uniref:DUF1579 domain-containing protein n=1 Tax=Streptomyces bathyalis TaxID=2710756 RepID=A0A7T1TBE3_9ACTN|nr:hypothetical protein [Streptomyces bathyalis]QPP09784.1 hypothetical protein G4Z16_28990 [Streptomyces bathyalis]
MREPVPHHAARQLEVLVGDWDMWALGRRTGPVRGSFTWAEGGAFLVQRTDVVPETVVPADWEGHLPFPTVTMTGYDDSAGGFTTLYADGRGVARVYGTAVNDGVWTMRRAAPGFHQRFTATVEHDGGVMTGGWEHSADGADWAPDFDVTYVRRN